jgi:hypothetical protein
MASYIPTSFYTYVPLLSSVDFGKFTDGSEAKTKTQSLMHAIDRNISLLASFHSHPRPRFDYYRKMEILCEAAGGLKALSESKKARKMIVERGAWLMVETDEDNDGSGAALPLVPIPHHPLLLLLPVFITCFAC